MKQYRPLPRSFFARHTVVVARALLGHLLVHETPSGVLVGRIVETEAYRGADDPASHAFKRTARSAIMFGRPGIAYVYRAFGLHACLNVVTEPEGRPGAVLLRAIEPAASGPGRLTVAMAVGLEQCGADLTAPPLYLAHGGRSRAAIAAGPRIGISAARDRAWRFGLDGHPALSRRFPPRL
ncbi:MAG: DNA-3-methyladenine glycosylase [bacterium]|nr:DNA-3-methyladenine glycosylase [bacterium]